MEEILLSGTNIVNETLPLDRLIDLSRMGIRRFDSQHVTLSGNNQILTLFLQKAELAATALTGLLREAHEVLNGRGEAAMRLRLILQNAIISDTFTLPDDWLLEAHPGEAPAVMRQDVLMDLIAATVWSSRDPDEENELLASLRQLLDPLFQLEYAYKTFVHSNHIAGAFKNIDLLLKLSPVVTYTRGNPGTYDPAGNRWKDGLTIHTKDDRFSKRFGQKQWSNIWSCIGSGHKYVSMIDRLGGKYTINAIVNPNACAGEQITILGENFGTEGRVYFPIPEVDDPMFEAHRGEGMLAGVEVITWTDNAVTVTVPPWAVSGMLHLNAFRRVESLCWTRDIYRLGNEYLFSGGLANIYSVYINGSETGPGPKGRFVINPVDTFTIGYRATDRSNVTVSVEIRKGTTVYFERKLLPGGYNVFPAMLTTDPHEPVIADLIITAHSPCGNTIPYKVPVAIAVIPNLRIEYIEITQGVQADRETVNAGQGAPLVANKDTAVRIHFFCDRKGWFGNRLFNITGSLKFSLNSGYTLIAPTNAGPGDMLLAGLSRDIHEFTTLNFLIPAAWCTAGKHSVTVNIRCDDITGTIRLFQTVEQNWTAKPALKLRWLFVNPGNYAQYDEFLQAPGLLRKALDFLPTPVHDVGPAWRTGYYHDCDLTSKDGWDDLLDELESFKECTVWDDINPFADHCESIDDGARWVALIPDGVNTDGSGLSGFSGTPSEVILVKMQPDAIAHELGHSLGRHHVNLTSEGKSVEGPFETVENGGYLSRAAFNVQEQKAIIRFPQVKDNFGRVNDMPGDLMSQLRPVFLTITNWKRIFDSL